jgi:hypothetical protein
VTRVEESLLPAPDRRTSPAEELRCVITWPHPTDSRRALEQDEEKNKSCAILGELDKKRDANRVSIQMIKTSAESVTCPKNSPC